MAAMGLLGRLGRALLASTRLQPATCPSAPPLQPALSASYHAVATVSASAGRPAAAPAASWALQVAGRLLAVTPPQVLPSCGMKMKGRIRRRCKHCYTVARHGRWYIMCPVHPRHKQMGLIPHPKSTWILTDVMTTPRRPW